MKEVYYKDNDPDKKGTFSNCSREVKSLASLGRRSV
jgi:hypothetical protein